MGLFQSKEQKEQKQLEKEMEILERYGLTELTDERDIESVKTIVSRMAGKNLMELGIALGGGTEVDLLRMQTDYMRALVEQNFIIMRMLNRLK